MAPPVLIAAGEVVDPEGPVELEVEEPAPFEPDAVGGVVTEDLTIVTDEEAVVTDEGEDDVVVNAKNRGQVYLGAG
jgi:hypothetical protein